MNAMMQPSLDTTTETEQTRSFDEITRTETAPLLRKILWQRLGFYVNPDGRSPNNPAAEELYNRILLSLTQRMDRLLAEPERFPTAEYRHRVISLASDECQNFLRARSEPDARLKHYLGGMLRRRHEFKIWNDADGRALCGFAAWEGRRISIASSERLAWLRENPESFKSPKHTYKSLQKAPYPELIAEVFQLSGDPIGFEDLAEVIPLFRPVSPQIPEQPAEPIEGTENAPEHQGAAAAAPAGGGLEKKERLKQLWVAIKQLPPESRLTLCLSPFGRECEDLWDLLLATDAVSPAELAEGLDLSWEQITELRQQAPLDTKTLANNYLGTTASQVNQWRRQAANQLRERFSLPPADWFRHEHLDYEQVESFAENRLDADETAIVNLHLETCAVCRGDVQSFREFNAVTANEPRPQRKPEPQRPTPDKRVPASDRPANRRKPPYAVAALLLTASAILAGIFFSRQGATGQQASTPASSPAPSVPSPSPAAGPGESSTASLLDGERIIRFNKTEVLSGLEPFPAEIRQHIADALLTGEPKRSADLSELAGGPEKGPSTGLIYPKRVVVTEDRPTFRWAPRAGASSYEIRISDVNGNPITNSGPLGPEITQWKPGTRLKRGAIFSWGLSATVNGEAVAGEARFKLMGWEKLGELDLLKNPPSSHLALGLFYLREGVLVQARRELDLLVKDNPNSPIAAKLLREAQTWR
jgi:hypothetical protein